MELEKLRTEDALKVKTQTQRIQQLEERSMDLANNHEKLIQFKNEHRRQHTQLLEENKRLQQENKVLFSQTVRKKEAEVLQLAARARKLWQQLDSLQEKCASESCTAREKELLEAASQQASAYAWEVNSLKKQLQHLQEKQQQTVAQLEHAEGQQRAQGSEPQAKLERANEKEQLLDLAVEQGKALQDKQWEMEQLGKKLELAKKARQRAGKHLANEAAAVENDLKAQELQRQLGSSTQAHDKLSLQFDAYRKHSMELLTKEKELNVKLRHFSM
ncbi:LOW QUALITY PROTEIN: coiled-coil domain-containing protein 89 [Alca torda]